jgi:hypothetical protein
MFVSGLVIFFPAVRACGEFVELGSSLVRVIWHGVSHPWEALHLGTISFSKLFNIRHQALRTVL